MGVCRLAGAILLGDGTLILAGETTFVDNFSFGYGGELVTAVSFKETGWLPREYPCGGCLLNRFRLYVRTQALRQGRKAYGHALQVAFPTMTEAGWCFSRPGCVWQVPNTVAVSLGPFLSSTFKLIHGFVASSLQSGQTGRE